MTKFMIRIDPAVKGTGTWMLGQRGQFVAVEARDIIEADNMADAAGHSLDRPAFLTVRTAEEYRGMPLDERFIMYPHCRRDC